ncbi:hypothetical protein IEQ34_015785 [Dendrobium chrysotoxum]|uniref:Uncharacterized protein n=1 Tax=Dendrobium chrysotoxum TaxID=161865 RepID=A0AAV7GJG0_DENCH|nr:hypothetical protein IEQ34_015785 [Dendrobium chrysotoxum]
MRARFSYKAKTLNYFSGALPSFAASMCLGMEIDRLLSHCFSEISAVETVFYKLSSLVVFLIATSQPAL